MAKGQESKEKIKELLQYVFPAMFSPDGKELRIPVIENGERVEIKIALTCAKENVGGEGAVVAANAEPSAVEFLTVTEEEKEQIKSLMERLGL